MAKNGKPTTTQLKPITKIMVEGFKAIRERTTLDIRPITVLCGANSSGKSSFLQPLLLMKQTLEHPYDPGPLLASGENVKFARFSEMLCRDGKPKAKSFSVGIGLSNGPVEEMTYSGGSADSITIDSGIIYLKSSTIHLNPNLKPLLKDFENSGLPISLGEDEPPAKVEVSRNRCFLDFTLIFPGSKQNPESRLKINAFMHFENRVIAITSILHIPALRGNLDRTSRASAYGGHSFPGRFDTHVASLLDASRYDELLENINAGMATLGLTTAVTAKRLDSNQIEVSVNRRIGSSKSKPDMVSIADVGFGVSQTLPVVAALAVAVENQFVYIEQPEIHLHPNAQRAMATLIVEAANRGVRVVIETHSSILLRALQTLIAKGEMPHEQVILHWFQRDAKTGLTTIDSVTPDQYGRTGDWPVDFDDVILQGDAEYLDAVEARRAKS